MEMLCPDQYNLKEIREALWLTLHDKGELWFGGEKDDWTWEWGIFQKNLKKVTETKSEYLLCAFCNNATQNNDAICDGCDTKLMEE